MNSGKQEMNSEPLRSSLFLMYRKGGIEQEGTEITESMGNSNMVREMK